MIYKNDKDQIYIEVNARQSGKTTRLIADIMDYVCRTGEDVYLLTPKISTYNLIINNLINISNRYNFNIPNQKIKFDISKVKKLENYRFPLLKNERIYVDEFAFIPNLEELIKIRKNMYFVSSVLESENNCSELVKSLLNYTHWRRKKIIDKLLNK